MYFILVQAYAHTIYTLRYIALVITSMKRSPSEKFLNLSSCTGFWFLQFCKKRALLSLMSEEIKNIFKMARLSSIYLACHCWWSAGHSVWAWSPLRWQSWTSVCICKLFIKKKRERELQSYSCQQFANVVVYPGRVWCHPHFITIGTSKPVRCYLCASFKPQTGMA